MNRWERQLRIGTGLVLALYVALHFTNHAVAVASFESLEATRELLSAFWSLGLMQLLLYASLLIHFLLALYRLFVRRTLKMPAWEAVQMLFGLAIVPLLAGHVIGTRVAAGTGGLEPDYLYVMTAISLSPRHQVQMPVLMLLVWVHLAFGLHFWLRLKTWYQRSFPLWVVLSVALPVAAMSGVTRGILEVSQYHDDPDFLADAFASWNEMDRPTREVLSGLEPWVAGFALLLVVGVLLARALRAWYVRRQAGVRIDHAAGRVIRARRGQTLLEAVRVAGLPHASVCGGRGRCTTCRVRVGVGREQQPEPSELEVAALKRIGAGQNVRLACQLRPVGSLAITPLVNPDHAVLKALNTSSLQGTEQEVVCMFVDMRGSTQMGERVFPYDVVYILNQFFNELSVALMDTGGHYAQFAGDGLMALYGLAQPGQSRGARAALKGANEMFRRLEVLNTRLEPEFDITIRMGIGIHAGAAIVGRMGPPEAPLLTAIGDNINIAARLESMTKTEGCDVIASRDTLDAAGLAYSTDSIVSLPVRGRDGGIEVARFSAVEVRELLTVPGGIQTRARAG